jgi:hypothetical protein
LEKIGMFYAGIPSSSDHDLWIRMKEITKYYFLAKHLLGYRKHNLQRSRQREMWEAGFDILERAISRYPYSLEVKRKRMAVLRYRLGMYDIRGGHYRDGFRSLLSAFILDPSKPIRILHDGVWKAN